MHKGASTGAAFSQPEPAPGAGETRVLDLAPLESSPPPSVEPAALLLVPARVLHGTLASCAANGNADLLGSALTTKVKVHAVAPTSAQLRELRGAAARAQEAKARLNAAAAEARLVPS